MRDPIDNSRPRAIPALAWLREWGPGLVVGGTLATVAIVAGFISYTHICALTLDLHQSWKTAHLTPLAVDGQIVIGSAVLATVSGGQKHYGWLGVAPGLAESLFANWESGIVHGHTSAIWATVAAEAFAVSSFLFERWAKHQFGRGGRGGHANMLPNLGGAGADPSGKCPHSLPGSLEEAIVRAFLHARDCMDAPLSQRALSEAFGQSRHKVADLVAPYLSAPRLATLNGSAP